MSALELLDSTSNAVVAKHSGRHFLGILIQGDTLNIICTDLGELKHEIDAKNFEAAMEIADILLERFNDLQSHYESVLKKHGLSLPY